MTPVLSAFLSLVHVLVALQFPVLWVLQAMRWGRLFAVGAASRALVGPRPCRDALACAARLARAFPDTRNRTALAVRRGVVREDGPR